MSDLFEKATRKKYRFSFRGYVSVEDLWDLTPNQLDGIYQKLREEQKLQEKESLLKKRSAATTDLNNRVEIVKYIVEVKLAEQEAKSKRAEKAEEKKRLLGILDRKQNEALENMSEEEIQKKLAELSE